MAYRLFIALALLIFLSGGDLFGQPCDIPPASDNCENAPLLCTFDEIDGFCFSMSPVVTGNGPSPLCYQGGAPHNVTWFAFYAGCTSLNITIIPTNCVQVNGQISIQAAIYGYGGDGLCPNSTQQPHVEIECLSQPCFNVPWTFNAKELTIGQIYYFMIDGCAGAYCDIEIDVITPCGDPEISPWSEPIHGPQGVCAGETTQYTIEAPTGGQQFHWYLDGNLIQEGLENTIEQNWPNLGTYELCVDVSNHCVSETDNPEPTCIVVVVSEFSLAISGDEIICEGEVTILDAGPGFNTYFWSTGDSTQSIAVANSGTYYVTVSDATGCSVIDSITVIVDPSPIGVATSNSPICISQSILLQASGGTTYQWSGPAGFQSTLPNPVIPNSTIENAGTYIVTVTNSGGCSDVDSMLVIIGDGYALSASFILPPCEGDTLFLFATGGNDYAWSGPNGFNSTQQNPFIVNAGPQHNGNYIVTDPNAPVCVANDTLLVTISLDPDPMITGNFNICLGEPATLDAGSGYDNYSWSTGQTGQTISLNAAGSYWVMVTNASGCSGQDTVAVEVTTNLNPSITGNLDVCLGDSSILNAGAGFSSYLWNTGDTVQIITVDTSGEYSVFVTNASGCEGTDTVQFKLWEFPQVSLNVDHETCKDSCDGQISIVPFEQGYAYYWSNSDTSEIIQNLCSGNYQVTVSTPGGCFVFDAAFVPAGVELKVTISDNDSLLIVIASGGLMPYTYLWSNGDTLQAIPNTPGMHTVYVTEAGGCVQSATILITQLEEITKKGRGIILYPNPTDGTLFISPLENKVFDVTLEYQIFNALGSIVSQGVIPNGSSILNLNISSWPAGRYVVQLVYEGGEMEVIPIVVVP